MKRIIIVLSCLVAVAASAQTTIQTVVTTNVPVTQFEYANATTGALLVKGMSSIGFLNAQITYPVEVRVERISNQKTGKNIYAVSLHTKVGAQTEVDYIDYDELADLIRNVPLISQAAPGVTPLDNFEVVYRTRSGMSVAKTVKNNKVYIHMTSGDLNSVRNDMAGFVLDSFGTMLTTAKAKIDAVIASGQ